MFKCTISVSGKKFLLTKAQLNKTLTVNFSSADIKIDSSPFFPPIIVLVLNHGEKVKFTLQQTMEALLFL
jgi:hypothetical protein